MTLQHFGKAYGANAPQNYEACFVPVIGEPLAADLVQHAHLQPGDRVLDVACGTGIVSRKAWERVRPEGSVTGLDINEGMLAVAWELAPTNISWREGSAEQLPFEDQSFDVVFCQLSLQFIPNRQQALEEMYRVLAPGGKVLISTPGPASPLWATLIHHLESDIGPEPAGFVSKVFSFHDAPEAEKLVTHAGFSDPEVSSYTKEFHLPPPREFLWQYIKSTPLMGMLSDTDRDTLTGFESRIVKAWEAYEEDGRLTDRLRILQLCGHKPQK